MTVSDKLRRVKTTLSALVCKLHRYMPLITRCEVEAEIKDCLEILDTIPSYGTWKVTISRGILEDHTPIKTVVLDNYPRSITVDEYYVEIDGPYDEHGHYHGCEGCISANGERMRR